MSFVLTKGSAMAMGIINVCYISVPVIGKLPVVFPNISLLENATPACKEVQIVSKPALGLGAMVEKSNGDEASASGGGGVISGKCCAKAEWRFMGSGVLYFKRKPALKTISQLTQNSMNVFMGMVMAPTQTKVVVLQ